ncbi:MAG: PDZ domain-containing protein [Lachnospiraceae bacterium]|nr:PDZ domain-containing protein [Lachnospiraceae bacterium]
MERRIYRRWLTAVLIFSLILTVGYARSTRQESADIPVSAAGETLVYPCGMAVGIYLQTSGVLIVGTGEVTDETGNVTNPAKGLVEAGDYIEKVNGQEVGSKTELVNTIRDQGDEPVELTVRRDGDEQTVSIQPVRGSDGLYMLGIWVRDDTQGIGTLTYVTEDGSFGALGHGISDTDTGTLVEALSGTLYPALVTGVIRATSSLAGSLTGSIFYEESCSLGLISGNNAGGIFGTLSVDPEADWGLTAAPVAAAEEVTEGSAILRSDISGVLQDYDIEIERVCPYDTENKNLVLHVTDPELLELTGGIIQGCSGSPILQDGKLVGAVTHVLLEDSTRGYGIFAETMLEGAAA